MASRNEQVTAHRRLSFRAKEYHIGPVSATRTADTESNSGRNVVLRYAVVFRTCCSLVAGVRFILNAVGGSQKKIPIRIKFLRNLFFT